MLERYYVKPETMDRVHACWLGESICRYVTWLSDEGYAARTVCRRIPMLMHFAEYSATRGASSLPELPDHVDGFVAGWVRKHARGRKKPAGSREAAKTARLAVEQMLRVVLPDYSGRRSRSLPRPFADSAPGFLDYLRDERGLRPASVVLYVHNLRRLERYLKRIGLCELAQLCPAVLSGFVTASGQVLGKSTLTALCGQLRVFLRYLYQEQRVASDLSHSFDCPRVYRLSDIPRAITWNEVGRLLASVDRRSPIGRRDYAVLLLLVTYGLRAREVASLTLDAIDWRQERLAVPERKGGHSMIFPLSSVVGEAIADYLQRGRPPSDERIVFLRAMAPHTPLGWKPISEIAGRRLRRAGIAVPRPGSHTLRHTCVQRLVEAQFSLKAIGDYVGHSLPKSTEIYTKIDLEALRELALSEGEAML